MPNKVDNKITLCAAGDVRILHDDPAASLSYVRPVFEQADISFCQLEMSLSEREVAQLPQVRPRGYRFIGPTSGAAALKKSGFDVISCAGNHCLDFGSDVLLDTIKAITSNGMLCVGAGADIVEARKPAIFEKNGTRVGFLAYESILPFGYWAEKDRPGSCPLRIYTLYENSVDVPYPGAPARIRTFPMPEDFEAMKQDITKLRDQVDVVIVSMHFGLEFVPALLAEYQPVVAHAAIDAGADLILGHHPHILKAVEIYKGKVIFYSMGNFAFDQSIPLGMSAQIHYSDYKYDPEYHSYQFHYLSRQTMIAKCIISGKKIERVSFLPAYIDGKARPAVLDRDDARFDEIVAFMKEMNERVQINMDYVVEGQEVRVCVG